MLSTPPVAADTSVTLYVRTAEGCSVTAPNAATVTVAPTAPGATTTFAEFCPAPDAANGATWALADTREPDNVQTYTVRKMPNGEIWMVQDMKFGNLCDGVLVGSFNTFQTGKVSNTGTFYGDCIVATTQDTPPDRGYLYDWAAAINRKDAYRKGTEVGCGGTITSCQGICPDGWRLPTGRVDDNLIGEISSLHASFATAPCNVGGDGTPCWTDKAYWSAVRGGYSDNTKLFSQGTVGLYWTSTSTESESSNDNESGVVFRLLENGTVNAYRSAQVKSQAVSVRCLKN
jgi:uncharacterized protein (TIGR02145 family)